MCHDSLSENAIARFASYYRSITGCFDSVMPCTDSQKSIRDSRRWRFNIGESKMRWSQIASELRRTSLGVTLLDLDSTDRGTQFLTLRSCGSTASGTSLFVMSESSYHIVSLQTTFQGALLCDYRYY